MFWPENMITLCQQCGRVPSPSWRVKSTRLKIWSHAHDVTVTDFEAITYILSFKVVWVGLWRHQQPFQKRRVMYCRLGLRGYWVTLSPPPTTVARQQKIPLFAQKYLKRPLWKHYRQMSKPSTLEQISFSEKKRNLFWIVEKNLAGIWQQCLPPFISDSVVAPIMKATVPK